MAEVMSEGLKLGSHILLIQFPGAICYNKLDHIGSKRKQIDQLQDLCNCSCKLLFASKVIFWTSVRSVRVRQIGRLAQLGLVKKLLRAGYLQEINGNYIIYRVCPCLRGIPLHMAILMGT